MIKIVANPAKISIMHEDNRVIKAIQLMRILAAIRYNNILQMRMMEDKEKYDVSLHIHLILFHAASLFEGINNFLRLREFVKGLEYFKINSEKIVEFINSTEAETSFFNRVLRPIRNKIAFHFDEEVITTYLADYLKDIFKEHNEVILISGSSRAVKDMKFIIADNLTINYALLTSA